MRFYCLFLPPDHRCRPERKKPHALLRAARASALFSNGLQASARQGFAAGVLLAVFIFAFIYRQLPPIDTLTDYRPKVPLRIWSADGKLIGEFGEERRDFVHLNEIPEHVKNAILSAEDADFYEHPGIEITGIARAAVINLLTGRRAQGGSTITQQVARNFFLTSERTYTRKLYEIAMSFKIESQLTKDQILEIYMNQIYLGQRAYGFSSAARTYFGRPLAELSVGEAATLAGLPVAPSAYNPIVNPTRATMRRNYVLRRMYDLGHIDELTYQSEKAQPMQTRRVANAEERVMAGDKDDKVTAHYAAELARMLVYDIFGDETYTRGLNVYTTINTADQLAAVEAVRRHLIAYDRKYGYRGPEGFVDVSKPEERAKAIRTALSRTASSPFMLPAVVLEASPKKVVAAISANETVELDDESYRFGRRHLAAKPGKNIDPIRPGSIIRVMRRESGKGKKEEARLDARAGAARRDGVRFGKLQYGRSQCARRRVRLQPQHVQPRHAGVAPARFELQAVHLFGRARQGVHDVDRRQRCADFD